MNDKSKSILAIMGIILILSGGYLIWGIRLYQESMDQNIKNTMENTMLLIDESVKSSHIIYDMHINLLARDEGILSSFAARDRDALFQKAQLFHSMFKKENKYYSNMHFHLPSGHSFLRMHKPEQFGDDLTKTRPMITGVHQTRRSLSGYEIGKHGLFYRVATPLFFHGEYIGALELGILADQIIENIEASQKIKIARVLVDKDLNDDFQELSKSEIHIQGFSIHPYRDKEFFTQVSGLYDFGRQLFQKVIINGRYMAIFTSGNLKNHKGETLAFFLTAQDISPKISEYRSFLIRSVYLTLIFVIMACIILHFSFGTYIKRIVELNKTLDARVKDRTKALKAVTDKLLETNAELNQIFNTAADGMRVVDANFRVTKVNDRFSSLIGVKKDTLVNALCHDHFRGPFCFSPQCTLNRILCGEEFIEIDVEKHTTKGETRFFLLTATPFKSPQGEILGVVENFKDITNRKKAAKAIEESEHYLRVIMNTVQAGVIITDENSPLILDANPYALKLMGCSKKELLKSSIRDHFVLEKPWIDKVLQSDTPLEKENYTLTTAKGEKLNIRLSAAHARHKGQRLLVQSFSDLTDIKRFIEAQTVDIHSAKSILNLVNPPPPRYVSLPLERRLFTGWVSVPCHAEGGDHLFLIHFSDGSDPKTIISLKDQSGHAVSCILRSIYTDLLHNALIFNNPEASPDSILAKLNDQLCGSGFFKEDDFFTSFTAEIDHRSLMMRYICAGHPPMVLIRNNQARLLPEPETGKHHLPIPFLKDAVYQSSFFQLEENDQILLYTDGLTEMPLKNLKRVIDEKELLSLIQMILNDHWAQSGSSMPVSALMEALLEKISALSKETVLPQRGNLKAVNTSSDDVTLMGLEIETLKQSHTRSFVPQSADMISRFAQETLDMIFSDPENKAYTHMRNRMAMILEEALVNAWEHGNAKAADKAVTLRVDTRNDFLFEIMDQGKGFDYLHPPDPTLAGNIEKQNGRGLFIIRHFSDHVEWKNRGSHIIASLKKIKTLDSRADADPLSKEIHIWKKSE